MMILYEYKTLAVRTHNTGHGKSYVPHLAFIFYILSQFIQ